MKHSVIFQGKKYISSKRASKISGYSSDYIGQLCRAQKIDARMLGRTWYVTEESLTSHVVTSTSPLTFKDRAKNFQGSIAAQSETLEHNPFTVSAKEASDLSGYSSDYIGQLCRGGKLEGRQIGHTWFVTRESLYAYVGAVEKEKKLAEFNKLSRQAELKSRKLSALSQRNHYSGRSYSSEISVPSPIKVGRPIRTFVITTILVALVAGGAMTVVYMGGGGNVAVNNSSVAGVYSAAQKIVAFFQHQYDIVVARILKSRGLTVRTDGQEGSGLEYGLAVTPSTGNASEDAARIAAIKSNFSDDVEVHPDQSGTAGVIKPIFRKADGTNFTYVLVPVKEKEHGPAP